ncbi:hypothetical protein Tco_0683905 [Tanacetum coccineum]
MQSTYHLNKSKPLQVSEFTSAKLCLQCPEHSSSSSLKSIQAKILLLKEYKAEATRLMNIIQSRVTLTEK